MRPTSESVLAGSSCDRRETHGLAIQEVDKPVGGPSHVLGPQRSRAQLGFPWVPHWTVFNRTEEDYFHPSWNWTVICQESGQAARTGPKTTRAADPSAAHSVAAAILWPLGKRTSTASRPTHSRKRMVETARDQAVRRATCKAFAPPGQKDVGPRCLQPIRGSQQVAKVT